MTMLCQTEPIIQSCLHEVRAEAAERRKLQRKPFFRRATMTIPGDPPQSFPAFCGISRAEGSVCCTKRRWRMTAPSR
jgi:hypothetical protein